MAAAASIAAVALALEVVLRAFGPVLPGYYQTGPLVEPDTDLGWRHVPSSVVWYRTRDFTSRAEVNAQGRLGPEIPSARSTAPRVLILGDSFAGATQVPFERTVAGLLPDRSGVPAPEVVDDGVSGYGTDQEVLLLERDGPVLRPDVVVLLFTVSNDVWNNDERLGGPDQTYPKPHFDLGPGGGLALVRPLRRDPTPLDALRDGFRGSALLWTLKTGIVDPLAAGADARYRERLLEILAEPTGEWERAWRITDLLLRRFAEDARRIGAAPLLVAIPDACQVHSGLCPEGIAPTTVPQDRLRDIARSAAVDLVDLLPAFRAAADRGARLYFPSDLHWNEAGHDLAAAEIARALSDAPLRRAPSP